MDFIAFNNYSNTFVFDTKINWPTIIIFWWIHWNEIAWVKVIDKLLEQLQNDEIKILKWKLILAYWNEQAINIWKRQVKYNLNRLFRDTYFSSSSNDYEINRVKKLREVLLEWDVLLDIHSTSSKSTPFMFSEDFKDEINITKSIWSKKIIIGWEKISWDLLSWDTNGYMHKMWKMAFTLECWQHNSDNAYDVWYGTSVKMLEYFGLLKKSNNLDIKKVDLIEMYKIETTKTWKFKFIDKINNFDHIKSWDLIWFDWDREIIAAENFIILLPNYEKVEIGEEIFYYWKKIINN